MAEYLINMHAVQTPFVQKNNCMLIQSSICLTNTIIVSFFSIWTPLWEKANIDAQIENSEAITVLAKD